MSYLINKAEFSTAAAHTLARSHGTKRETPERQDAAGLLSPIGAHLKRERADGAGLPDPTERC